MMIPVSMPTFSENPMANASAVNGTNGANAGDDASGARRFRHVLIWANLVGWVLIVLAVKTLFF
jgi:hypothetical protein